MYSRGSRPMSDYRNPHLLFLFYGWVKGEHKQLGHQSVDKEGKKSIPV